MKRLVQGEVRPVINLTRSKPSSNLCRFYTMHVAPTLFGEWAPLVAQWGRIGSPDTVREKLFQTHGLAEAALTKRLKIKTGRDYIPALWRTS